MPRIALAQTLCVYGDVTGNMDRIESSIAWSARHGADLVLLPETCVIGWINPAAYRLARQIPGLYYNRIAKWAKKYGVYVCVGLNEKVRQQRLYDSLVLIDPEGKLLLKYHKIHTVEGWMNPPYLKGTLLQTMDVVTPMGKIAVLICADSFNTDTLLKVKALHADFLLVPYAWVTAPTAVHPADTTAGTASHACGALSATDEPGTTPDSYTLPDVIRMAAPYIDTAIFGANQVGVVTGGTPVDGYLYLGASAAADRNGNLLAVAGDQPEVRLVDFSPTV